MADVRETRVNQERVQAAYLYLVDVLQAPLDQVGTREAPVHLLDTPKWPKAGGSKEARIALVGSLKGYLDPLVPVHQVGTQEAHLDQVGTEEAHLDQVGTQEAHLDQVRSTKNRLDRLGA